MPYSSEHQCYIPDEEGSQVTMVVPSRLEIATRIVAASVTPKLMTAVYQDAVIDRSRIVQNALAMAQMLIDGDAQGGGEET